MTKFTACIMDHDLHARLWATSRNSSLHAAPPPTQDTQEEEGKKERKCLVLPQSRAPSFCRGRLHDLTSCRTAWSVHNPMSLKMRLTLLSNRCCRVYAVGRSVNCLYGGSMTPLSWCRVPYGSLVQLALVRLQGVSSVTAGGRAVRESDVAPARIRGPLFVVLRSANGSDLRDALRRAAWISENRCRLQSTQQSSYSGQVRRVWYV
jgi:hypothetical protein